MDLKHSAVFVGFLRMCVCLRVCVCAGVPHISTVLVGHMGLIRLLFTCEGSSKSKEGVYACMVEC